ncbi:MAG TPA: 50S ribosomal protein L6, partial [Actinomycetota bacterium]|nr:50S ribosomal protein L6 [Actinomycetota bacterium]
MSRIGRSPITIPQGVDVSVSGNHITVKGPKATLQTDFHPEISVGVQDGVLTVTRPTDERTHRALHGLTRSLIANMVHG